MLNTPQPALIGEGLLLGRNIAMDITNDSGGDTRYTVKNGSGSGMGGHHSFPFRPEDTVDWKVLAAGATDHLDIPASKGPWLVYFYVNGQGFVADATSDNDQVHLVAAENGFRTMTRKVAHSTGRVVVSDHLAKSA
jgi:hypothetical protein